MTHAPTGLDSTETVHRLLTAGSGAVLSPVELLIERLSFGDRELWIERVGTSEMLAERGLTYAHILIPKPDREKLRSLRASAKVAVRDAATSEDARVAAWLFLLATAAIARDDADAAVTSPSSGRHAETFAELAELVQPDFAQLFREAAARMGTPS